MRRALFCAPGMVGALLDLISPFMRTKGAHLRKYYQPKSECERNHIAIKSISYENHTIEMFNGYFALGDTPIKFKQLSEKC